ncbi:hypothetical protein TRIP_C21093 [Candidatus Zixiibacteriota bacterium]|nr:hypothetical protein TRIP_C21093 [candidate division Zixibacteria bacterium]
MITVRDWDSDTEYFVGTCSHTNESEEIDICGRERIEYLKKKTAAGLQIKVGFIENMPAGFLYMMPVEISPWGPLGKNLMYIPCMYVIRKAEGLGVGRAMLAAAEDAARLSGKKGIVTTGFYHDFWFMPAAFFERAGFRVLRKRKDEALLGKDFFDPVAPPEMLRRNFSYAALPDKVKIEIFWNRFCQTSNMEARRVREVAAEFGERVHLQEYDADNGDTLRQYQIPRGIYIDGNEIGWGYEAPRNGLRAAITKALEEKDKSRLDVQPIRAEQYEECMRLMLSQAGTYLERTMELMQMDRRQFGELFRTVGQVFTIRHKSINAGFYWIEAREKILHVHALIIKDEFQGQGLGSAILRRLEKEYRGRMNRIEMGVHTSNERAIALYRRLGYEVHKSLDYLGFLIMQKDVLLPKDGESE